MKNIFINQLVEVCGTPYAISWVRLVFVLIAHVAACSLGFQVWQIQGVGNFYTFRPDERYWNA
jgi:hypothetical protein